MRDDFAPTDLICGYCEGAIARNGVGQYVHAEGGERVKASGPGDLVSALHNRAGTRVNVCDVIDPEEV